MTFIPKVYEPDTNKQDVYDNKAPFRKLDDLFLVSKHVKYKELTQIAPDIWVIDESLPSDICDKMIDRFESEKRTYQGSTGGGVNKDIKDSKDFMLPHNEESYKELDDEFFKSLNHGVNAVREQVSWYLQRHLKGFDFDTGYQIQKTTPGGKYVWHTEVEGCASMNRTLTFLWYLNDEGIKGGETGFARQGVKVQPRKGRLVLFAPYWTHVHAGLPLEEGVKYIATGWIHAQVSEEWFKR